MGYNAQTAFNKSISYMNVTLKDQSVIQSLVVHYLCALLKASLSSKNLLDIQIMKPCHMYLDGQVEKMEPFKVKTFHF